MARDDHLHTGCSRVDGQLAENVQYMNAYAAEFKIGRMGNGGGPAGAVVVAAHHGERRDVRQRIEHAIVPVGPRTDVAGVDEMLAACQRRQRLRPQQAVRVGNQPDLQGATPQVANSGSDSASRSA